MSVEERGGQPWLPSFGRRSSRHVSPAQQALMHTFLPRVAVIMPQGQDECLPLECMLQIEAIAERSVELEIGFGGAEHLLMQADARPETLFIGCDPFEKSVASLLSQLQGRDVDNVRIYPDDARIMLLQLPDHCLSHCYILFPDPWPKARHHKRRIVNQQTLDMLARVLKPQAILQLATDIEDYASWMLEQLLAHPSFRLDAPTPASMRTQPERWITTRYQRKANKAGRETLYIEARTIPAINSDARDLM